MSQQKDQRRRQEIKVHFIENDLTTFLESYESFIWHTSAWNPLERNKKIQSLKQQLYQSIDNPAIFRLSLFYMGGFSLQEDIEDAFPEFSEIMEFSVAGSYE